MMVGTMTPATDAGREAIARLIALAGLGTSNGQPREPHGEWTREDFETRILTIIPTHCEQQCFALADRILALAEAASQPREGDYAEAARIYADVGEGRQYPGYHEAIIAAVARGRALTQRPPEQAGKPAFYAGYLAACDTTKYDVDKAWREYAPEQARAVPAGWKVVPVEPTSDMIEAARAMFPRPAYVAMLSAAPTPSDAGPGEIPAGMVAWHGGYSAPQDWDGGPVLLRDGDMWRGEPAWTHIAMSADRDIIAYTPKAPPQTPPDAGSGSDGAGERV